MLPHWFHHESGRPRLFELQRDWALDQGDDALVATVERRRELWHRPPEEWEYQRNPSAWSRLQLQSLGRSERWAMADHVRQDVEANKPYRHGYVCSTDGDEFGRESMPTAFVLVIHSMLSEGLEPEQCPDVMEYAFKALDRLPLERRTVGQLTALISRYIESPTAPAHERRAAMEREAIERHRRQRLTWENGFTYLGRPR